MPQTLGSKERTLFGQVVKCYENKQYKKGLKAAEQILRKNPNHGDTQAMKSLILNSQGLNDEAFVLAKEALKNDMKSHVCWHVYGLLYRSAKNYEESIKAYKFALRLEPESHQIQRDLALLQMQMRDYAGYVQSRKAMLQARAGLRSNWTALAIAHHLSGDLIAAERTLTAYEDTLGRPPPKTDTEHQDAVLYKNSIIAEMGQTERALEHLDAVSKHFLDREVILELRGGYLLKLGKLKEAEAVYRSLIDRNPENRSYYESLQKTLGIENSDIDGLRRLYAEFAEKNPKDDAPRRIPLNFLVGEEFRESASRYLQQMLKKAVPSTFNNVKALYADQTKMEVIQTLVEGFASGKVQPTADSDKEDELSDEQRTKIQESAQYFLAQHYNYHRTRALGKALEAIERALEKSPESVDYHMTKARILKHSGNIEVASEVMEKARTLDVRDRYINTKAAKYQVRLGQHEKAIETMGKFTRPEAVGGPLGDLVEMQCVWFLAEDGESYLRQRKLGLALKRFSTIFSIFDVWVEDQFDFHSFSLKKGQVRAYVTMVRWEDHIRDHPFYTRAALGAIKAYIMLSDRPHLARGHLANGSAAEGMNDAERKKAARKARKAQERAEQKEAEKREAKKNVATTSTDGEKKKEDPDPNGEELVKMEDPLKDAMRYLTPMLECSPKSLEVQEAGFEVFLRRKKYLLALRCLLATKEIAPDSAVSRSQILRLRHALDKLPSALPAKIAEIIDPELQPLVSALPNPKPGVANEELLAGATTIEDRLTHMDARYWLECDDGKGGSGSAGAARRNTEELAAHAKLEGTSMEDVLKGLEALRSWDVDAAEYLEAARERWPDVTAFKAAA